MSESPADMIARARASVRECMVSDLADGIPEDTLLVDVREPEEVWRGCIPGAVAVPRGLLELEIHGLVASFNGASEVPDVETPILLYCASGGRSALAAETLERMGYRNVVSLAGGIVAWHQAGLPIDTPD
ncbi:MAG: rhodanese-like domain-containing protein [Woeseiaceae bacterium]|nr:rhodanese-like domain-containing protein [Woeseiaceae bacterium]